MGTSHGAIGLQAILACGRIPLLNPDPTKIIKAYAILG
jgi:hypothetical protein